jgi:glycosyltransferase involved in cell wall biosynthesis
MTSTRGKQIFHQHDVKPRVLFLSDHLGYAEGIIHGATTYFLHVLPALQQAGIPLTVVFLRNRHPVAEQLEQSGIQPIFLDRGKWDMRAFNDLTDLVQNQAIQFIHAAGMKGSLLGRRVAGHCGISHAIHLHDANPVSWPIRFLQRMDAQRTEHCLCISNAVAAYARSTFHIPADRITVLHNPLPDSAFIREPQEHVEALRAKFQIPDRSKVIALVGRLSPEKGHAAFLRALPAWLSQQKQPVHLLIAGEGPERAACENIIGNHAWAGRVTLAGHRNDIRACLSLADVLVMPSIHEGLGYAALEAMAAGCPVVAFAVGGLPELIAHEETGLLAPPDDYDSLFACVSSILDQPQQSARLSMNGLRRARDFAMDKHIHALVNLYQGSRA